MSLVLCAHGTRSPRGRAAVAALVEAVAARVEQPVLQAFVDVHGPYLSEVLRPGMTVVPLLLAPGYHVHVDIARAATRIGEVAAAPPLGPSPLLSRILVERLGEARLGQADRVVLAAAGSSHDAAARSVAEAAGDLSLALRREVTVAYGASRSPSVPEAVAALRRSGARRVVVAAYLLAPGHFHTRLVSAGADAVTAPLIGGGAAPDSLVELVLHRASCAPPRAGRRDLVRIS